MKIEIPSRIIPSLAAIKRIFVVAFVALVGFYVWAPIHEEVSLDEINLREISFEEDDEFFHGTPVEEDFEHYCWREYLRRSNPESGWYTCVVNYEQYYKSKLEVFYGL